METKAMRINGDDLIAIGYIPSPALGVALRINQKRHGLNRNEMMTFYAAVLQDPTAYLDHKIFAKLAKSLIEDAEERALNNTIPLKKKAEPYAIYGKEQIEAGALKQMNIAMQLPVTVAGALMPDAHQGYGLPIGGVLATKNAIIPYGVGVDIGCRMALTVFDIPVAHFEQNKELYKDVIMNNSVFGAGHGFRLLDRTDHAVLENKLFQENAFIADLKDKAWQQLGSSGGGNHFVEFGILEFAENDAPLGIAKGAYLALLTHSGSRGFGATIAGHYTQLAKNICKLPYEASNLAYLDLNTQEGNDYWLAMNLAGDYASACHEVIHQKITVALGAQVLARVENHHNFAWKEQLNGEEVIVHRKGATPAGKGVMGIIPGSMTAAGFLVRGNGATAAINSASHGAGRQMSRTQATKSIDTKGFQALLDKADVTLLGGGRDEAPIAYKDIFAVMQAQTDLVDIVAQFSPKMVRMADDGSRED
ncbi:tRNA-splicing ligase RtcB [Chitinophaga dinghuensis]|uniref:3'-phosphate/5'-hydroxy nucleic acid ligase n=1 Tax=Chitinophaga dinghuensis TaxID=1539050 RepID=A0A327VS26_9BACT|nr:RtcB family protein [Chitinophaga dinghuensis]RAJ76758.1 tRNA-splicing ligase RtcB [Chitinophaga dinghuensis]